MVKGWHRRDLLAASSATISTAFLAKPAWTATRTTTTLAGMDALELFLRLRCTGFDCPAYWWYTGRLLVDREGDPMRPLFSVQGAAETRIAKQPDGRVRYSLTEAGYYGDLVSGEIIDGPVTNPYNGKPFVPQHYLSPQQFFFTPDMRVEPVDKLPPNASFNGAITPPDIKGSRIWMAEDLFVDVPGRDGRAPLIANSLANFEAAIGDVLGPRDFVPTSMQYTTFNSFRSWMNMGDIKGHVVMRLSGIKLDKWSRIPDALRARISEDHPGVFGHDH